MNRVIMQNLRYSIFYMKTHILQDFYICISVRVTETLLLDPNDFYHQQNDLRKRNQNQLVSNCLRW